jgi:hypothetical protein
MQQELAGDPGECRPGETLDGVAAGSTGRAETVGDAATDKPATATAAITVRVTSQMLQPAP